jgi:hypothetical protein
MRTGTSQILFGFFAALFVASQANIIAHLGPVAGELFSLQLTMSPETFREILEGWDADELSRYRSHFAWDSVHPLIYGGLLGLWILVVHRHRRFSPRALRILSLLAVTPPVLDYVENGFHIYLETNRSAINTGTVLIAGGAATLKWLCAGLITVLLTLASARALGRKAPQNGAGSARRGRPAITPKASPAKPTATRAESGDAKASKAPTASTASTAEPAADPKSPADTAATIPKQSSHRKASRRGGGS